MAKKKKKVAKKTAKAEPKRKIVDLVRESFEDDLSISTDALIKAVQKEFPKSKFNKAHVSFYRTKFRGEGMDIPKLRTTAPKAKPKGKGKKKKAVRKGK